MRKDLNDVFDLIIELLLAPSLLDFLEGSAVSFDPMELAKGLLWIMLGRCIAELTRITASLVVPGP